MTSAYQPTLHELTYKKQVLKTEQAAKLHLQYAVTVAD
jgi:hypothetical protein